MKSKQLFDDEPVVIEKVESKTHKKSSNKITEKEIKTKPEVIRNENSNNNTKRGSSAKYSSTDIPVHRKEKDKEDTKRVSKSDGKAEQKPAKLSKENIKSSADSSKSNEDDSRKAESKKSRSRKSVEDTKPVNKKSDDKSGTAESKKTRTRKSSKQLESSDVVKEDKLSNAKRAELIEDWKNDNAPEEYLIGTKCPKTGRVYEQLNCCKRGWTYMDVSDLKWMKEHIGYDGTEVVSTKYDYLDKRDKN